ncbi:hypothetical protein LCGC14_2891170 [marine sediment metagenome]|uniref:Uncharacterized protein n=1 Tax=marine sediment metagenome TaxID=412755 RepID=A0A0F8YIY9_9ZZZZ
MYCEQSWNTDTFSCPNKAVAFTVGLTSLHDAMTQGQPGINILYMCDGHAMEALNAFQLPSIDIHTGDFYFIGMFEPRFQVSDNNIRRVYQREAV